MTPKEEFIQIYKENITRKGADELIGKIRRIADTNDETEALLAFIGEMSGGKSMLINVLVFPYDNSKKIRAAVRNLDAELILFLEDIFDGDNSFLSSAHRL